jgi:hypothetical protein
MHAFSHLKPSWRAYIAYVEMAARRGNTEMAKVWSVYKSLPKRERRKLPPEAVCDRAGVRPSVLAKAVAEVLWPDTNVLKALIVATNRIPVIHRLAQQARGSGPAARRSREMFLRITGDL